MRYNYGVRARLVFTDKPNVAVYYNDSEDVYGALEPYVGHYDAEDASCWTEMAAVDSDYRHDDFTIEMVED